MSSMEGHTSVQTCITEILSTSIELSCHISCKIEAEIDAQIAFAIVYYSLCITFIIIRNYVVSCKYVN